MSPGEIDRLIWLYRSATNDLAQARTLFPGAEVEAELNSLVAAGHDIIYRQPPSKNAPVSHFLLRGFPDCVRRNMAFIAVSFVIMALFTVAGGFLHRIDDRLPSSVVPRGMMRVFEEELGDKGRMDRDIALDDRSVFSSMLITNNIKVSFAAFALGISFGVGTSLILALNGLILGCVGALFHQHDQLLNFLAYILPHGALELAAIVISGGAGLMIGYALLNPGEQPRGEALKHAAGEAVELALGVAAMLVVAGVIEAFFTPLMWIPDSYKVAFAGFMFLAMLGYFARAYRREGAAPDVTEVRLASIPNISESPLR